MFLHPMGSLGHVLHDGAFGARNVDRLFFMLGWGQYVFNKKCVGARYTELVFLHPVGSAGHVVRSSAFGVQNVEAQ
jgi:hypothetical protein